MIATNYISFKDPAARVVFESGKYLRYIFNEYKSEYDHLMSSGLYKQLVEKNLLVSHQEIEHPSDKSDVYKLICPDQIPFQSYPFEWSYTQWRKAMLSYLRINKIALSHGMILKDATPYNFYFKAGQAIMFDTSSFIFFKENDPWLAYRQFAEEFLGPIALMHYNGNQWGRITISSLRGFPLNFISKQLPLKSWFNITTLLNIHIHSKYSQNSIALTESSKPSKGFSTEKVRSMLGMIEGTILRWKKAYQFTHHWSGYYENDIESAAYLVHKEEVIRGWLDFIKPNSVLDLGANTGKFSFIASEYAENVIALEFDDSCVDQIEAEIRKKKIKNVTALAGDLTETTPDLGALNKEHRSIFNRGKSYMVFGLALIHHLSIVKNLSFSQIAEMFSNFSNGYVIIEFIPKGDSKVSILLKDKTHNYKEYNEAEFINALSVYFNIKEVISLKESLRKLILLEKLS